jgi:tRNA(Leu) C34 or U34 (ribose-2'-O)-methylase TrmL
VFVSLKNISSFTFTKKIQHKKICSIKTKKKKKKKKKAKIKIKTKEKAKEKAKKKTNKQKNFMLSQETNKLKQNFKFSLKNTKIKILVCLISGKTANFGKTRTQTTRNLMKQKKVFSSIF